MMFAFLDRQVVKGSEILEVLHDHPKLKQFLFSLYNCHYSDFFRSLGKPHFMADSYGEACVLLLLSHWSLSRVRTLIVCVCADASDCKCRQCALGACRPRFFNVR